jgi:hypothetical protein
MTRADLIFFVPESIVVAIRPKSLYSFLMSFLMAKNSKINTPSGGAPRGSLEIQSLFVFVVFVGMVANPNHLIYNSHDWR